ncbi:protein croquemort-like isoform X2 [Sitophilus oryzae]|uniref:Protein croquemort-like isoform X2 n=1 Tax=Sitophilus oryzae TaxID=7048 RepID=A0A6J2YHZ5_SITOR|nr:protein croquemort-like isoform X2 [Sitophilus oryzae]
MIVKVQPDSRMYYKKSLRRCLCLCGTSIFLVVFGIVIISIRTIVFNYILSMLATMQPNSITYNLWKENPVPLTLKLYLFNWTNAHDLNNHTIKPRFKELGPYIFDETKVKTNITWNANDTVSFYHLKTWWFNSKQSKGSLDDQVTTVNPIALSTASSSMKWSYWFKKALSFTLTSVSAKIYGTHSAGELLFEGHEDPLLNMANNLPAVMAPSMPNLDKFGWFYGRNHSMTYEGLFNMGLGKTTKLGELYSWKTMNQTPYYSDHCGNIKGSDGDFFPSGLNKESIITFFSPDMCRYIDLEFEKEVNIKGIMGLKYSAGRKFLDNGTTVPENDCFCQKDCMPSGALDISACRYGSPAYVSLPHFHKADRFYTDSIEGLKSEDDLHDFFMVFEPTTGIPLEVAARLQLNLMLKPVTGVSLYEKVPEVYIPVLWFEQVITLPDNFIFSIKAFLSLDILFLIIGAVSILVGIALQLYGCYKLWKRKLFKIESIITREEVPLTLKKI